VDISPPRRRGGFRIVLCQEIFGVNATMRQVADYYAEEGYTVLVPDLFWRIEPGIELPTVGRTSSVRWACTSNSTRTRACRTSAPRPPRCASAA
jgi:dienelactone hydrolase